MNILNLGQIINPRITVSDRKKESTQWLKKAENAKTNEELGKVDKWPGLQEAARGKFSSRVSGGNMVHLDFGLLHCKKCCISLVSSQAKKVWHNLFYNPRKLCRTHCWIVLCIYQTLNSINTVCLSSHFSTGITWYKICFSEMINNHLITSKLGQ